MDNLLVDTWSNNSPKFIMYIINNFPNQILFKNLEIVHCNNSEQYLRIINPLRYRAVYDVNFLPGYDVIILYFGG